MAPDSAPHSQSSAQGSVTQVAGTPVTLPLPPPGQYVWTLSQNALLFNIVLQKAESDLAHGKLRDAAELSAMGATSVVHQPRLLAGGLEEDKYTGEIPKEVKTLASQFAGLLEGEIAKIFANKFRPMNLYKLRHMRGCDNMYRDQIQIEEGTLKMKKVTGSYKDYGRDNVLWSEAFQNYTMIVMALFGSTNPSLHLALHCFHREMIDLSTVYEWQGGVLLLALDFYTHIIQGHPTDSARREIPAKW